MTTERVLPRRQLRSTTTWSIRVTTARCTSPTRRLCSGCPGKLPRILTAIPHPSSSASSTSSSSSDRVKKKKKQSKVKKEKSPSKSSSVCRVVRVKATDMKLGQWPTTLQFAGWRRAFVWPLRVHATSRTWPRRRSSRSRTRTPTSTTSRATRATRCAPWTASSPTPWPASPRVSLRAGSLSRPIGRHCRPTSRRAVRRCR